MYKRVLLKFSGEALVGQEAAGIDPAKMAEYVASIKTIVDQGISLGIVVGGGNFYRGKQAEAMGIEEAQGHYMGMLATMMNGIALQSSLERAGMETRLVSALTIENVCEPYVRRRVLSHLKKGKVVIFSGGTGHPFFTTDTAAALRAVEIGADVLIKATRVDGIYTADPEKDPTALRYEQISFKEVLSKQLRVMDMTAFAICQERHMPIIVFDMNKEGNLLKIVQGEKIGTLVVNA